MSIRPTDLQIIVQKAQEVERVQQSQQQQQKVQQQQAAEHIQKQSEIKEHQVNSAPHADEVKIHNKEKGAEQESHAKKGKQKGSNSDSGKESKEVESSEHIIDLKI